MSRNLGVQVIQFKILNGFYWTPSRLFRLGLKESAEYWRCEMEDGNLMHALWSRSKIQKLIIIFCCPVIYVLGDLSFLSSDVETSE